jgi:hypothetical protein
VHDGTIYLASNRWVSFGFITRGIHADTDTSTLYALDAKDGKPRWSVPLDAPVFGTYAIANGVLYHPTLRGVIYARKLEDGSELWKHDTGAPIGSGMSVSEAGLFVSGGFALGAGNSVGQVVHSAPSPGEPTEHDLRVDTFKDLTLAECQEALMELQPNADCRTCLCDCNPSTTGACREGCWEQAPCVVENCPEADLLSGGQACYNEHCTSKLLPPNVYQESVRSAVCVVACAIPCGFGS